MPGSAEGFFAAVLSAGAILSGFCGTFLSFRIQREAGYYRQVALDFRSGMGKDVYVGLTHFTSAFLLLILATACSAIFGFALPLLALNGAAWVASRRGLVVGGMIAALVLLGAYFIDELVHYNIVTRHLVNDAREWRAEWWIVVIGILAAGFCAAYFAHV
jgi:hypothetical protein